MSQLMADIVALSIPFLLREPCCYASYQTSVPLGRYQGNPEITLNAGVGMMILKTCYFLVW